MDIRQKLKKKFEEFNIIITEEQCEKFQKFHDLLMQENVKHNLTAIKDEEEVITRHYVDSLAVLKLPLHGKIIDIGCGAGFPSIPIAIINPELEITAVDSVGKKTNFVKLAATELNLRNVNVINGRVETLAHSPDHRERYSFVINRALAPLNTILEYSSPLLRVGGFIYSYKGKNYTEEISNSTNALKLLNCKIESIMDYSLDEKDFAILVINKFKETSKLYPRNQNKPRLKPL